MGQSVVLSLAIKCWATVLFLWRGYTSEQSCPITPSEHATHTRLPKLGMFDVFVRILLRIPTLASRNSHYFFFIFSFSMKSYFGYNYNNGSFSKLGNFS